MAHVSQADFKSWKTVAARLPLEWERNDKKKDPKPGAVLQACEAGAWEAEWNRIWSKRPTWVK